MKLFDLIMLEFRKDITDWKQAIHIGVKMLVENKKATWKLEEMILESTATYGAYYVLEKGLALVHAPAGEHCIEPATSTLILDKEIVFNDQEDKVAKIIITLSAPDNDSHFQLISQFAQYFMDVDFKSKALAVSDKSEFINLLTRSKYEF
ncbi:PTS sugar transporter subunit IIA [Mycoplasma sp. 246B]